MPRLTPSQRLLPPSQRVSYGPPAARSALGLCARMCSPSAAFALTLVDAVDVEVEGTACLPHQPYMVSLLGGEGGGERGRGRQRQRQRVIERHEKKISFGYKIDMRRLWSAGVKGHDTLTDL